MKKILKETKGITLIALVITIVVLIILAGVLINLTLGDNGLFTRSKLAKERYEYGTAKEILDIRLVDIQAECAIEGEEYTIKKIAGILKQDTETQIQIEKYYADTVAKESNNAGDEPVAIKGIVVSVEKYSKYKFLIGKKGEVIDIIGVKKGTVPETWTTGDMPEGFETPIAFERKLGSNAPTEPEEEIKIGYNLSVVALETNTSNLSRKTNIKFSDLFDTTWEQDGKGTQTYSVTGNLEFKNTEFTTNILTNISQLELGSYRITYTATTPGQKSQSAYKDVTITSLAQDSSNNYEIWSSYDLARFRKMINDGQTSINVIQKDDLDMTKVCSATLGSWEAIGLTNYFMGTYDGGNKSINDLYLNETNSNAVAQGLFSRLGYTGTIQNVVLYGSVLSLADNSATGGIVGRNEGTISNCTNYASVKGNYSAAGGICGNNVNTVIGCTNYGKINDNQTTSSNYAGGIAAYTGPDVLYSNNENTIEKTRIENCTNNGIVFRKTDAGGNNIKGTGGIVGVAVDKVEITNCHNINIVTSEANNVGGIVGKTYSSSNANTATILKCSNTANITSTQSGGAGGIVGEMNRGGIYQCYTANCNITSSSYAAGGILARCFGVELANCYTILGSTNTISTVYENAGGIIGIIREEIGRTSISNCYVIGNGISANGEPGYQGAICGANNRTDSEINNCYYLSTVSATGTGSTLSTYASKDATALDANTLNKSTLATNLDQYNVEPRWTTESGRNNGYPILIYNKADLD